MITFLNTCKKWNMFVEQVAFSKWVDMMVALHGEERIAEMTVRMRENPFILDSNMDYLAQKLVELLASLREAIQACIELRSICTHRPDVAADIMEARIEAKRDE